MSGAPKQPLNFEPAEPRSQTPKKHRFRPVLKRQQGEIGYKGGDGGGEQWWLHPHPEERRRHCPLACSIS
tara:strand:- start:8 stop:217 length:210 start_codon:yes stop_codon:yes gene_type:complete